MESKQLADLLKQAKDELDQLKNEAAMRRRKLTLERVAPLEAQITQLKRQIDKEVNEAFPYSDFDTVETRIRVLSKQLDEAKVAEAKLSRAMIGRTVQEWRRTRYGDGPYRKAEIGIVDVYDGTNIGRKNGFYNLPAVGELFIRNIRKDGTPGKVALATVPKDALPGGWYPLGVDPNTQPTES